MSDSLHTRLVAAVTARRQLAEAALPWPDAGIAVAGPTVAFLAPDRVVAHIAANRPEQILRDTAAATMWSRT